VLTTTSDSPQRDVGREIGVASPQSVLLRLVAVTQAGRPAWGRGATAVPETPVADLPGRCLASLPWDPIAWLGSTPTRRRWYA